MNCNDHVSFIKVKENDIFLDDIRKTYETSFPDNERREFSLLCKLLTDEPAFSLFALFNKNDYIGFITVWNFDKYAYIEHFAIEPTARNGGFGAKVMQQFLKKTVQ